VDDRTGRYPVATWATAAVVTVALAVAIRLGAAVFGVEVVIPDRDGGDPVPLDLAPIVLVTVGAFVAAVVLVLVLDRVVRGRSRGVARIVALVVLALSLVPVYLGDLPTDATVVLTAIHLLVGIAVIRTVIRP
jgi:hypothetical protein